jgi:hypothetical protein
MLRGTAPDQSRHAPEDCLAGSSQIAEEASRAKERKNQKLIIHDVRRIGAEGGLQDDVSFLAGGRLISKKKSIVGDENGERRTGVYARSPRGSSIPHT